MTHVDVLMVCLRKKSSQCVVKVESKHFVKIRITSREWRGSTQIHHTITARFCPHKKANEPKARAASSLSGIRLKKVDEKNSMVAVFRSMARGLTISVSQDKIGKPPFPFVDNTSTCSNNFCFKVSGAHERICPDQQDPDNRLGPQ